MPEHVHDMRFEPLVPKRPDYPSIQMVVVTDLQLDSRHWDTRCFRTWRMSCGRCSPRRTTSGSSLRADKSWDKHWC